MSVGRQVAIDPASILDKHLALFDKLAEDIGKA